MPSLMEELNEIASLTDVEAIMRRKNARKSQHTRLLNALQAMKDLPYRNLRTRDLERKEQEVERATQLFQGLQHRHEALLADQEAALASEIEAGQQTQADYDALADLVAALQDKASLYRETSVLLDELQTILDSDSPAAPTYQEAFTSLKPYIREIKCKAKHYPDDDDIKGFVSRINESTNKYQHILAEAEKAKSATPPPVISTSTSRESSEPPATRITVSSRLRLDLPKFNGEPTEWLSFKALFSAAMERDGVGISDQEKCTHLLACMTSPTAKLTVRQFATQLDGYKDALQALEDTYGGCWRIYPQHVAALTKPDHYSYNTEGLRRMRETIDIHLKGLAQCKGDSLPQFLASMFIQRFDKSMSYEWSNHWEDMEKLPTIQEVRDFFRKRELRMVENPNNPKAQQSKQNQPSQPNKQLQLKKQSQPVRAITAAVTTNNTTSATPVNFNCPACNKERHPISRCQTFLAMNPDKRQDTVRKAKFCFNCLYVGHQVKDCPSPYVCRVCKSKLHHTLLHKETAGVKSNDGEILVTYGDSAGEPSVLSTAKVMAYNGRVQQIGRALLDSGSVPSLVTEGLANALKLTRTPCDRSFTCATGNILKSTAKVTVNLAPLDQSLSDNTVAVVCHVVRKLPSTIPPDDPTTLLRAPFLTGRTPAADPELGGEIDLLLGVSDSSRCHRGPRVYTEDQAGYIAPTLFGWVLGGRMPGAPSNQTVLMVQPSRNTLDLALERLWEIGQINTKPGMTEDETSAVEQFKDTYQRLPDGRFMVTLPKKSTPPILGESRSIALKRFLRNEKSLMARGLLDRYNNARQEYFDLGHAEVIPCPRQLTKTMIYYIPAHGVLKESSTTTKMRVVFDASCKSSTGHLLNDMLLTGPNLYPHLTTILNRFRMHRIAVSGDIGKMFREIVLNPDDRDLHRFLHRNEQGEIVEARMLRLTFGVASSPYLATQVLLQLAADVQDEYPEVSQLIQNSFYVDDCLTGAASVEEAATLVEKLRRVLTSAGMTIRKFRSNSPELLQTIPSELCEKDDMDLTIHDPMSAAKTLGVHWPSMEDKLHVSVPSASTDEQATKRRVASAAAKVYDVLGFFSPVTIRARMLLQQMWAAGLDWDEDANDSINQKWQCWVEDLPAINQHAVSRRLQPLDLPVLATQLHGFSDASEKAYGAVVYLRTIYKDTTVTVTLVMSKARVAPIKTTTIPRLELVAATMLAHLLEVVAKDLNIPRDHCYAWTDSTIVLAWLQHAPSSLQTFQANRVTTIVNLTGRGQWRHVRTHDNPADMTSRGTTMAMLTESDLWWCGPSWLKLEPGQWPHSSQTHNSNVKMGLKAHIIANVTTEPCPPWQFWSRYSSYERMKRVLARVRRFINNLRHRTEIKQQELSTEELKAAHLTVLKWAQRHSYPEAISLLSNNNPLSRYHALGKYDARLDDNGLLLIKGRVRESKLHAVREKIPLSLQSPITRLLIRSLHNEYGHPGTVTMMGILADTYYISGIRNFLKRLGRACVVCQRTLAQPMSQRMADLPTYRTTPAPPFFRTGLDFAGPFMITRGNPRKPTRVKAYAVLFVCLVTRAVHIELCADLTTEAFLACLKRFCARRGTPGHIHSDNGTNLVGAKREILELQDLLSSKTTKEGVSRLAGEKQLQWHLIPPRTPHFGGLWEAGVKAMKQLLKKKLTTIALRYDELESILIEVEATLNSRPLGPLSSTDPDSPEPLTAGHFLIGRPLLAPPPTSIDLQTKMSVLKRWNLVQRLSREIWDKWVATCLQAMQARHKWHTTRRDYRVGDIVLVKDDTITERTWPLGRVARVHPGKDGRVRVVTVRCQRATYKRGIDRLVLLIDSEDDGPTGPPAGEDVQALQERHPD